MGAQTHPLPHGMGRAPKELCPSLFADNQVPGRAIVAPGCWLRTILGARKQLNHPRVCRPSQSQTESLEGVGLYDTHPPCCQGSWHTALPLGSGIPPSLGSQGLNGGSPRWSASGLLGAAGRSSSLTHSPRCLWRRHPGHLPSGASHLIAPPPRQEGRQVHLNFLPTPSLPQSIPLLLCCK